jgi:hypothetical protein
MAKFLLVLLSFVSISAHAKRFALIDGMTAYEILELVRGVNASQDEVEKAFDYYERQNRGWPELARFEKAYEYLRDPEFRRRYDAWLEYRGIPAVPVYLARRGSAWEIAEYEAALEGSRQRALQLRRDLQAQAAVPAPANPNEASCSTILTARTQDGVTIQIPIQISIRIGR